MLRLLKHGTGTAIAVLVLAGCVSVADHRHEFHDHKVVLDENGNETVVHERKRKPRATRKSRSNYEYRRARVRLGY